MLTERLRAYSPDIEPSVREPGVFWLDAAGLHHLFPSPEAWALAVRQELEGAGFVAAVVVGFRRFGTYAVAKSLKGRSAQVYTDPDAEDAAVKEVPLALVGLTPSIRDNLAKLGVRTVGRLLTLPAHGIRKRFGEETHQLYRFAAGDLELPLNPVPVESPVTARLELDYLESNAERLVFLIKPLVDQVLHELGHRGKALTELVLRLTLDQAPEREEHIRTAEPTLASVTVMELVKLRIAAAPLSAPVTMLFVLAIAVPANAEQLRMFQENPKRDLAAAARAFARLRAAFGGDDVVVKPVLRDRHSPEGSYAWEPLYALTLPHPRPEAAGMLVREIFETAEPLPHHPQQGPDGWLLGGLTRGPVAQLSGPYRISGGWWRTGLDRDYYFAEMHRGELLWVYYDRQRRRWFLQGEIT
jgi:protein ImuB